MNAETLLAHYDRIADASSAVSRLRMFILDLAVWGKLVPQDPTDEPASQLLKKVAAEKVELAENSVARKNILRVSDTKAGSDAGIPPSWLSTDLQTICLSVTDGDHLPPPKTESGVPFLVIGNVRTRAIDFAECRYVSNEYYCALDSSRRPRQGDLLYTLVGSYGIPVVIRDSQPFCVQRHIGILRPSTRINVEFLARVMESKWIFEQATACATGIAQKTVPLTGLRKIVIPLPPLAEQHRIVAKVDELMALCDRLEAERKEREVLRDRLVTASLHRLTRPAEPTTAEAARTNARFVLDHLGHLTTRVEHIKQLRQTILDLAVRGKLVPQDPGDEPAEELLERVETEKAQLVKAGEIGRDKRLPPVSAADISFALPLGWGRARLGNLSKFVTSGSRDWAKHYSAEGAIFVRMGNLSNGHYRLRLDHIQRVNPPADGEGTRTRLEAGDILISITGDVGMLGLIPEGFGEAYINQHTAMVRPMPEMKGRYLAELFRSPFAQEQFNEPQRGIKNSFRLSDVTQFVVPLPPLAEQHRIVAMVDELMALCDQLEVSLATAGHTRGLLLEAALHEALAEAA